MVQVPRKIYYDLATGNLIQDTGEHSGDVIETTEDQDFAAYISLSERVKASVGCLTLAYGDHATEFSTCSSYRVNPTDLTIEFSYTTGTQTAPITLERRVSILEDLELQRMVGG